MASNTCTAINCEKPIVAQHLCATHYKQLQRHGVAKVGSKEISAKRIDGRKLTEHPLYEQWRSITRVKHGTQVCERWQNFENFVKDVKEKPEGSIGLYRLDRLGLFEKENTAWRFPVNTANKREYQRTKAREFYARNPGYARWSSIKAIYGLTQQQYEALLARQSGVCAICEKPEMRTTKTGQTMNLHIDHCHKTKIVRGLLCSRCNTAIGFLNDDLGTLAKAVEYLKTYKDV